MRRDIVIYFSVALSILTTSGSYKSATSNRVIVKCFAISVHLRDTFVAKVYGWQGDSHNSKVEISEFSDNKFRAHLRTYISARSLVLTKYLKFNVHI